MEKEPDSGISTFTDVETDMYYEKAVAWANGNEIVMGVSENTFAPNDNITREQMATILYRYAKFKGIDVSETEKLSYSDVTEISPYAKDAVMWNKQYGIMGGNSDGTFAPKNNATRAEAAAVFVRMFEKLNNQ